MLLSVLSLPVLGGSWRDPLPSPLTLDYALNLADQAAHPDQDLAEAALQSAMARQAEVDAQDDIRLDFSATLRAIDPSPIADDPSNNDSGAKLLLTKRLYDFGRTQRARNAAEALRAGQQWHLLDIRQQRRLEVMARFFDVLLADLQYARDNEAMSIAYVRLDRGRNRNELGQLSDIELLELESRYQQSRRQLFANQNRQRITRSLLAISLNRPDDLPAELEAPAMANPVKLEEVESLTQRVITGNPALQALRAQVESAKQQLLAAESEDKPVIRGELEAAAYNRDLGGRNPLSASLVFEMPLFSDSRVAAATALQRARLQEQRATLAGFELDLRQQVLEHWLELQQLQIRREELVVEGDFRDLFLERSRTLYDLEVASDLGDSMVQIADLHLEQAQNEFQTRLLRARLDALSGSLLPTDAAGKPK